MTTPAGADPQRPAVPAPRGAVLMIHGLGGTQYDLGSMHKVVKQAGFVTHSLTLPGHGTQPEDLLGVVAEDWIDAVTRLYREILPQYETLHVCGMCMGALLATELVKRERHVKGRLVALAPPIFIDGWSTPWYAPLRTLLYRIPALARKMKIEEEDPFGIKNALIRSIVKDKFARGEAFHYRWVPLHCVEQVDRLRGWVMAGLERIACPVLVCHAREDELTSPKSAAFLAERIGAGRTKIVLLDNSYHMICVDNDREQVGEEILRHFGVDPASVAKTRRPGKEVPRMATAEVRDAATAFVAALTGARYEQLLGRFASSIVWHQPGAHALAGDHEGRSRMVTLFSELMARSGGSFRIADPSPLMVCDQVAAFSGRITAARDGAMLDQPTTFVLRLEAGKVAEVWLFDAAQDAADAFWGGRRADAAVAAAPAAPMAASVAPAAADLDGGDLDSRFLRATGAAKALPQAPDNATRLELYALYKQATQGDATGSRPGFADPVGRAKHDAWAGLAGTPAAAAKERYLERVRGLLR